MINKRKHLLKSNKNKLGWAAVLAAGALLLGGCVSSNAPSFQPDVSQSYQVGHSLSKQVAVGQFTMPANAAGHGRPKAEARSPR